MNPKISNEIKMLSKRFERTLTVKEMEQEYYTLRHVLSLANTHNEIFLCIGCCNSLFDAIHRAEAGVEPDKFLITPVSLEPDSDCEYLRHLDDSRTLERDQTKLALCRKTVDMKIARLEEKEVESEVNAHGVPRTLKRKLKIGDAELNRLDHEEYKRCHAQHEEDKTIAQETEIERLRRELAKAQTEQRSAMMMAATLKDENRHLTFRNELLTDRVDHLERKSDIFATALEQCVEERDELRREVQNLKANSRFVEDENLQMREKMEELENELADVRAELDKKEMSTQLGASEATHLSQTKIEVEQSEEAMCDTQSALRHLKSKLMNRDAEIEELNLNLSKEAERRKAQKRKQQQIRGEMKAEMEDMRQELHNVQRENENMVVMGEEVDSLKEIIEFLERQSETNATVLEQVIAERDGLKNELQCVKENADYVADEFRKMRQMLEELVEKRKKFVEQATDLRN